MTQTTLESTTRHADDASPGGDELDLFAADLPDDAMSMEPLPDVDAGFNCVGCFGTTGSFGSSSAGTVGSFGCGGG